VITARTFAELRAALTDARSGGRRIGLVPTMGYLHEGHLHLCDAARGHADVVVMSIFVNPLQFGPSEDLERYPRDFARDSALAEQRSVDVLFVPADAEMYPHGDAQIRITAPRMTQRLCGAFRPGHFDGVLTVVAKLFNLVHPDVAVFGQKDLQQAVLIRRMVSDLDFGIEIVVAPIVREGDGVAMSSRNIYLTASDRTAATVLSRALRAAQERFTAGESAAAALRTAAADVIAAQPGVTVQYIDVVNVDTLEPPARVQRGDAIALAAFVGKARLIDNHIFT
jgi:pantoate--beta-alanine ligase